MNKRDSGINDAMNRRNLSIPGKPDRAIREHCLVSQRQIIVIAVSGGVDSVVLLDYLASLKELELTIVIAHLNHSLRGSESDGDEQFVRNLAERYGSCFESRREDVASLARRKGLSLEEAGRECRYRFFKEVAQKVGAASVAVAHHLDDQAETVLLRLLRGSGPTGLRGMSHRSANGMFIRPLLDVTRAEIEDYAAFHRLAYRTDSSNADPAFLRNRIRLQLLPDLSGYNPAIAVRLAETAAIMAADEALLSAVVAKRWQEVSESRVSGIILAGEELCKDMPGMRLRLYRLSLENLQGDLRRISYRHLREIDRLLLSGPPNGSLNLPDGIIVFRSYGKMVFTYDQGDIVDEQGEITIFSEGVYDLPCQGMVSVAFCDTAVPYVESDGMEMIADISAVPFPWVVRTFRHGDRFVPRGMTGHKKVKDLFIDEKIPRIQRRRIPLFFSGDNLFWVAGLRRGGTAYPYAPDARLVRIRLLEFMQDTDMLA